MNDKRKLKRRHLIFYLKVIESTSNCLLGFLVDITTEGIMIMSDNPIETGKTFHLKMLIDSGEGKEKYLEFSAESRWCRQSVRTEFYDTGFKLLDINPETFKKIKAVIMTLGFND